MTPIPELPSSLDGGTCAGQAALRFEDITQDGTMILTALPQALGGTLWPAVMRDAPSAALMGTGIFPILSRMVLEGGEGPLSVFHPLRVEGRWHSAHVPGPDGDPERLLLMMWATLHGRQGLTHDPSPPGAPVVAGQVFAEHILTRLFAAPEDRRVTRLELPGWPPFPPGVWSWRSLAEAAALPEGATVVGRMVRNATFGLMHTDPNQHVNSLVYPRLFEETVLHLAIERGRDTSALRSRRAEIVWRKPFFAGETATIAATLYEREGRLGAAGTFSADGRPRSAVHLAF